MSLFKKRLKIGRRVAVIAFNFDKNRDEFRTGKIVAIKAYTPELANGNPYAVRFDDGEIQLFRENELFTEWGEK